MIWIYLFLIFCLIVLCWIVVGSYAELRKDMRDIQKTLQFETDNHKTWEEKYIRDKNHLLETIRGIELRIQISENTISKLDQNYKSLRKVRRPKGKKKR